MRPLLLFLLVLSSCAPAAQQTTSSPRDPPTAGPTATPSTSTELVLRDATDPAPPPQEIFPGKRAGIAVIYTASVQGYVEPCGCTGDPLGGIARYKAVIDSARRAYDGRVVVVDAGDLLFEKASDNAAVDRCQAEARTRLLVSTYARAGVVATTRGALDDVRGADFRDALLREHKLTSLERGASTTVERGEKKIAIVGVDVDDDVTKLSVPPADAVIVLAQMTQKQATARPWQGVDVVIVGKAPDAPVPPQKAGSAVVVSAGWQAQHAGVVELHLDGRAPGQPLALDDRVATADARKKLLDVRIGELEKLLASLPPGPQRDFQQQRRDNFVKERAALNGAAPGPMEGPHLVVSALPLKRGMPEEKQAAQELAFYEKSIPQLVGACEQSVTCPEPPKGVATYVGVASCQGCHAEAVETWKNALVDVEQTQKDGSREVHKAGHSKAWQTLVDAGRDKDRTCIACHSSGFDEVGGACTTTTVVEKGLTAVQCESCHGPGSDHVASGGDRTKIRRVVDEQTCRTCHQPPHIQTVADFVYEARLPAILGPGHQRKKQ